MIFDAISRGGNGLMGSGRPRESVLSAVSHFWNFDSSLVDDLNGYVLNPVYLHYLTGKIGNCIASVSGVGGATILSSGYVFGDNALSNDFTLQFWGKPGNSFNILISQDTTHRLNVLVQTNQAGTPIAFFTYLNSQSVSYDLNYSELDTWHMFTIIKQGNTLYRYVDTTLVSATAITTTFPLFPSKIQITVGQLGYEGVSAKIDLLGYWTRALSAGDVTYQYNSGAGRSVPIA